MYLFHSHNIVGCLASIRGFWENDTYTQGGTFVVLIVNRPKRSLRSLFSSFFFLLCNITGEKNHCNNARSDFQLPRKKSS